MALADLKKVLYYVPLFFETVRLLSPREAGLYLVPCSAALSFGSLLSGYVVSETEVGRSGSSRPSHRCVAQASTMSST